jgi:hypothetical protein
VESAGAASAPVVVLAAADASGAGGGFSVISLTGNPFRTCQVASAAKCRTRLPQGSRAGTTEPIGFVSSRSP